MPLIKFVRRFTALLNDSEDVLTTPKPNTPVETRPYLVILTLILASAFWLRWQFLQTINLYPDEFVTLLAMDMIGQKGIPILPSGLFYEHGLLYSYLAGVAAHLGEPVFWGRFTSLSLGLLTIILVYHLGQRWFSPPAGILAAMGLALAPAAIAWSGRVRMYALLQLLVLLTLWFMLAGLYGRQQKAAWLAVVSYAGALLTQFVSLALLLPLSVAEIIGLQTQPEHKRWYRDPKIWLRGMVVGLAVLVAIFIKRAGQPKGTEALEASNAVSGIWLLVTIYADFSFDIEQSWQALAPFFTTMPLLIFTLAAPIAVVTAFWPKLRYSPVVFLAVILLLTTGEILLIAPADRRDEKYLFMLMPLLLLLGGQGIARLVAVTDQWLRGYRRLEYQFTIVVVILIGIGFGSRRQVIDLLSDIGEDYTTTFIHVAEHLQPGEAILTGTPTAAYHYLKRNDYYAVQAGGPYDYRILNLPDKGLVERWLGSPWLQTAEELNEVLQQQTVWFVLERWGLLIQYYDTLFMQNILAQTEFIREDNGIIALKSLPNPLLLPETPRVSSEALMNGTEGDAGQLIMRGYSLEGNRLTLYWEAVVPVSFNYTVFVNVRNQVGEQVLQVDHPPLGSIYPTTLWQPGALIRETSYLDLPPGIYELRVGMYRLETGERLWVPSDETLQNMVYLGDFEVDSRD